LGRLEGCSLYTKCLTKCIQLLLFWEFQQAAFGV
jgi:hypothetical protein